MDVFGNALSSALSSLFNAVPAIIGALVILIVFWIISGILGGLVRRILEKLRFDTILGRIGAEKYMQDAGVRVTPSAAFGSFIKWFIRILGISAAVSSLGLVQVSVFLNQILAYLPNVLVAVIILMLGVLIAQFVGRLVTSTASAAHFPNAGFVGKLAQYALLFFIGLIVLQQLQVGSAIVVGLWAAVSGGLALALAIAVGFGGRDAANSYLSSRLLSQDLKPGMIVALPNGLGGRILTIGAYYTTLATNDGQVKVPNNQVMGNSLKVISAPTGPNTTGNIAAPTVLGR